MVIWNCLPTVCHSLQGLNTILTHRIHSLAWLANELPEGKCLLSKSRVLWSGGKVGNTAGCGVESQVGYYFFQPNAKTQSFTGNDNAQSQASCCFCLGSQYCSLFLSKISALGQSILWGGGISLQEARFFVATKKAVSWENAILCSVFHNTCIYFASHTPGSLDSNAKLASGHCSDCLCCSVASLSFSVWTVCKEATEGTAYWLESVLFFFFFACTI